MLGMPLGGASDRGGERSITKGTDLDRSAHPCLVIGVAAITAAPEARAVTAVIDGTLSILGMVSTVSARPLRYAKQPQDGTATMTPG